MTRDYIQNIEDTYHLIMNLMDDEEREHAIKQRLRDINRMSLLWHTLCVEFPTLNDMVTEALAPTVKSELYRKGEE
mgnify:CR=1 FL=1